MATKDRESQIRLSNDARVVYLRSSTRPVEYALLLQRRDSAGWKTVLVADNSHEGEERGSEIDEHHCHRYLGDEKQRAESLPFCVTDTNDAMAKVIKWFKSEWEELIS